MSNIGKAEIIIRGPRGSAKTIIAAIIYERFSKLGFEMKVYDESSVEAKRISNGVVHPDETMNAYFKDMPIKLSVEHTDDKISSGLKKRRKK